MIISLIAAMDAYSAIGKDNDLPWRLPNDLKRFKALSLGKPILMGRKTADSLGRALPGRTNLVMTRSGRAPFEGMQVVASVEEARGVALASGAEDLCVIGGAEIYALALPLADRLHLTYVDTVVDEADAFFPAFNADDWQVAAREPHAADAKHAFAFEFVDYARR
ncbi:MAG: dihydrofolate reductase [Pseudoxanthomonas sp.]